MTIYTTNNTATQRIQLEQYKKEADTVVQANVDGFEFSPSGKTPRPIWKTRRPHREIDRCRLSPRG